MRFEKLRSSCSKTFLYELWPADNQFFFNGRIQFGPKIDNLYYLFTIALLFLDFVPYAFLVQPKVDNTMIYCFFYIEFFLVIGFFLALTFTDPGIIPRASVF